MVPAVVEAEADDSAFGSERCKVDNKHLCYHGGVLLLARATLFPLLLDVVVVPVAVGFVASTSFCGKKLYFLQDTEQY